MEAQKYIQIKELLIYTMNLKGNHWTSFIVKDNKSYFFDSFRGASDTFLLTQLPKPITYQKYKIQDKNSKICGSYAYTFSIHLKE